MRRDRSLASTAHDDDGRDANAMRRAMERLTRGVARASERAMRVRTREKATEADARRRMDG